VELILASSVVQQIQEKTRELHLGTMRALWETGLRHSGAFDFLVLGAWRPRGRRAVRRVLNCCAAPEAWTRGGRVMRPGLGAMSPRAGAWSAVAPAGA
jgi:hypothetical protein